MAGGAGPPVRARCRASPPRPAVRGADPATGVLLAGRYRLVELVGRGATARVWRGRDELLDRDVAVKQVDQPHSHGLIEARLAARVRHPHVAGMHDVVEQAGSHWLVMDYCGGASLADVLRGGRRRLPGSVTAALGLQLLAALRAVHAAGVVHCDVKPANVLLSEDGRLVLVDFGIAETIGGGPVHPARRTGQVIGSPAYMAPELVRGEAPRPAADLWSLGATLYTVVEGRPPFPQAEVVPTLTAVLHDPPQPARRANRLQPLLALLLDKDPARRPSHDGVQALLTAAYPAHPTPVDFIGGGTEGRRAARSAAASRAASGATCTLPSPRIPLDAAVDAVVGAVVGAAA
jgi:eukaryotic-like serine/threonine-protein kinase